MTSHNEDKKTNIWMLIAAVAVFIYGLFTAILLGSLGHFPSTQGELLLLAVFLYSLNCASWLLALGQHRRPGIPTSVVGFAGILVLSYALFFA